MDEVVVFWLELAVVLRLEGLATAVVGIGVFEWALVTQSWPIRALALVV